MSLSAAAVAIITLCHRGDEQRAEAGGQASRRYGAGYRHVCSCRAEDEGRDEKKEW